MHKLRSLFFIILFLFVLFAAPKLSLANADNSIDAELAKFSVPMLGGRALSDGNGGDRPDWAILEGVFGADKDRRYQLGSEWGKQEVTEAMIAERGAVFARVARATANVRGATGFYLGKFAGQHVVATNHHVCFSHTSCANSRVSFRFLGGRRFSVRRVYDSWANIDLALLEIQVNDPGDEAALAAVAANFNFAEPLEHGQELLTIGFGTANNPFRRMMANQDSDCIVYSGTDEFRLMRDPDEFNPGPYAAWSFSNGCDVSHGDSGSAMVDRITGQPVGIIWTGKVPKNSRVQEDAYMRRLLADGGEDVWTELSYAVPAMKIKEVLEEALRQDNSIDTPMRAMLEELLR